MERKQIAQANYWYAVRWFESSILCIRGERSTYELSSHSWRDITVHHKWRLSGLKDLTYP